MTRIAAIISALSLLTAGAAHADNKRTNGNPIPLDRPAASTPAPRQAQSVRGLDAVMGKDMATLVRMFGQPRLDVVEVQGRKLQFSGRACILDAYLYPEGRNGQEIVIHVDARRSDGAEVDRTQCISALSAR